MSSSGRYRDPVLCATEMFSSLSVSIRSPATTEYNESGLSSGLEDDSASSYGTEIESRADSAGDSASEPRLNDVMIPYHTEIHRKLAPADRTGMEKVPIVTNFFPLEANPDQEIWRYDVNVELILEKGRQSKAMSISRGPRDDGDATRRHQLVLRAVRAALEAYGAAQGDWIFDGAATMFTNADFAGALKPHNWSLTISVEQLSPEARSLISQGDAKKVVVNFQPCREVAAHFTLGDALKAIDGEDRENDRPLRQFLELLTSYSGMTNGNYTFFGSGKAFLTANNPASPAWAIGHGHERRHGVAKGIRFLSSKENGILSAIVLDAKVGSFYKANSLVQTICEINGWSSPDRAFWNRDTFRRTNEQLKGVRLQFLNNKQSFICEGLGRKHNVDGFLRIEECFDAPLRNNGRGDRSRGVSVAEKYRMRGIRLEFLNWPVVKRRGPGNRDAYEPIEILGVSENQRVPLCKAMTKPEKADGPVRRWNLIQEHLKQLELSGGNGFMARFGVIPTNKPMRGQAFRRPAPSVRFQGNAVQTDKSKASWRTKGLSYTKAADVPFVLFAWSGDSQVYRAVNTFAPELVRQAKQKGITVGKFIVLPEPTNLFDCIEDNKESRNPVFDQMVAEQKSCEGNVIFIYVDPLNSKTHGILKLLEVKFQIITQHITSETVLKALSPKGSTTYENLLHKFNVKCEGLNYTIAPELHAEKPWFGNTMIMGYDVAHPTAQTAGARALGYAHENPSVVGFAANVLKSRDAYVGDYHFQEPLREQVQDRVLHKRTKWLLTLWMKNHPKLPDQIYILRDGVSEGQYDMVVRQELAAIQESCDEFEEGYRPKFVLIVVTKRHNKRFFKQVGDSQVDNPDALTVVDRGVVRSDLTEFYLQSHSPLQGTAKATQYELLVSDDPTITQDTLQSFVLALCFEHQISSGPVSIPEPVYQSDEWAKRGTDVFKTYKDFYPLPRKAENRGHDQRAPNVRQQVVDWEKLTKRLSYIHKSLEGKRVNA